VKHYSIKLTTLSPLAIRADHAPTGAETAKYIAGSTLAGSLASVYRLLYSEQQDEFDALFLSGQVSYPNLYPASYGKEGEAKALQGTLPVFPVPKTAQSCKRYKGFLYSEDDDDERHGVRDTLLDWAMFKLGSKNSSAGDTTPLKALKRYKECPHIRQDTGKRCDATMDRFDGYYSWLNFYPYSMISAQVDTHLRLQTHTGINRETGTVKEGILYNRQVFEEDMSFWGMVKLPDDERLIETFEDFITKVSDEGLVRIGTGRTRGLGKVELQVAPIEEEEDRFRLFKKRLVDFDDKLKSEASENARVQSFYFALTLHSPVILSDPTLRYRTTIDGRTLAELARLLTSTSKSPFELVYQAASGRRITGWNELWGTPKTNEYAIEMGSVFLFSSTIGPEDALLRALFALEEQGIGRRWAEGFGRVCFSDPFHLEVTLR
jgi:CRISPR-associated protein Csx10